MIKKEENMQPGPMDYVPSKDAGARIVEPRLGAGIGALRPLNYKGVELAGGIVPTARPWSIETSKAGDISLRETPWSIETSAAGRIPLGAEGLNVRHTSTAKAIRSALRRGEQSTEPGAGQGR